MIVQKFLRRSVAKVLGVLLELGLTLLFSFASVQAANITWIGNTSSSGNTSSNWAPAGLPGTSSSVIINTDTGNQPIFSTSFAISNLTIGLDASSGNNTLLTINGGLLTTNRTIANQNSTVLGVNANATGALLLTGLNARLSTNNLFVGNLGNGLVTVANGGNLTSNLGVIGSGANSTGSVLVTDNAIWTLQAGSLTVGNSGSGNLTIANGANVTSSGGIIGNNANSTGSVLVTGGSTRWNLINTTIPTAPQNITVGNLGSGCLTVANGTHFLSSAGLIGNNTNSTGSVTITGAGSVWTVNQLTIGNLGSGCLTVANAGSITSNAGSIGRNSTVIVTDPDSSWNLGNHSLSVGSGNLIIANGGNVSTTGNVVLASSQSTVVVSDISSQLNAAGLILAANSSITQNGGTIHTTGSISLSVGAAVNLNGGTLQPDDGISINGSGNHTLNLAGGTLRLKAAPSLAFGATLNTTLGTDTTSTLLVDNAITWATPISGSGNLQIGGNGTLSLATNHTYTGATIIKGWVGVATLANGGVASSLGASSSDAANLIIDGGTLAYGAFASFSPSITDRLFTIGPGGATIGFTGIFQAIFTNTGALAFSGPSGTPVNLTFKGIICSFAPSIEDNGPGGPTSVTINGASVAFYGNKTYTGNTTVNGSTLVVQNTDGSATGSGTVLVNGYPGFVVPAAYLAGTGTIAGNVVINAGGAIEASYSDSGTLTVGGLCLQTASALVYYFDPILTNNQIVINNANGLVINGGTVKLQDGPNPWSTPGNYLLMYYSGSIGGLGLDALTVDNPQPGLAYNFSANGSAVQLAIANVAPTNSWNIPGNGSWDLSTSWQPSTVPDGVQSIIGFTNGSTPTTVTLDASHTVGQLYFNSPGGDYILQPTVASTLLLDNGSASARIDALAGNSTVVTPLTLTGNGLLTLVSANATLTLSGNISETAAARLTKGGNGLLTLSGNNTYSGGTALNYGTLDIQSPQALGSGLLTINGGNLANDSGASITLAANNPQTWTGSFGFTGPSDLDLGTGNITAYSIVPGEYLNFITLNVSSGNLTVGGSINGGILLTKEGNGALLLKGSITGNTSSLTVNNGTLRLSASAEAGVTVGAYDGTGTATLILQDGAVETNQVASINGSNIGLNALLVTGTGSLFVNTGYVAMGGSGSGQITVANGGLLSSRFLWDTGSNSNYTINVLTGGTLQLTSLSGIGAPTTGVLILNLAGGTLQFTANATSAVNGTFAENTTSTVDTTTKTLTLSGSFTGNGSLVKVGTGLLQLTGNDTYTGTTTVAAGTLTLSGNGSISTTSAINLNGTSLDVSALTVNFACGVDQTLAGTGTVALNANQTLVVGGPLVLGAGTLAVTGGHASISGPSTFTLNSIAQSSKLSVAGTLTMGGNLTLNLRTGLSNGVYPLFSAGSLAGDFTGVSLVGTYTGTLTENGTLWTGTASGISFSFDVTTGQLTVAESLSPGISAAKQAWLKNNFSIAQIADSHISGDGANPAGDGINNLAKYAFNLNAWLDGHTGLPQPVVTSGNLVLTFATPPTDVSWSVEASDDLDGWSTGTVTIQTSSNTVTASHPLPPSGRAFMRVNIAPAP